MFTFNSRTAFILGIVIQAVLADPNAVSLAESPLQARDVTTLERRDVDVCGYVSGDYDNPFVCPSGQLCTRNEVYDVFGCCTDVENCIPLVGCVPYGGTCDALCQTQRYILCGYTTPYCVRGLLWQSDASKWYTDYGCATTSNDFKIYPTATDAPTTAPVPSVAAITTALSVVNQAQTSVNNPAPASASNSGSSNVVDSGNGGGSGDGNTGGANGNSGSGNINGNSGVIMINSDSRIRSLMRVDICLIVFAIVLVG